MASSAQQAADPTLQVGIAADHGGFVLKGEIGQWLRRCGYQVRDFGAFELNRADDYLAFIVPMARAVAAGQPARGIALCTNGVGVSITANKLPGVRAGLVHDVFCARRGVEDDDMNVICLGGGVITAASAIELIRTFLNARFSGAVRHQHRLAQVRALEMQHILS